MMRDYWQWRLLSQYDVGVASGSVPAQRERWNSLSANGRGREGICVLDANIEALTWTCEDLPSSYLNVKIKNLFKDLFDKKLHHSVTQLVQIPTHAHFGMATKCLDHMTQQIQKSFQIW